MNVADLRADPGYGAMKEHILKHTGLQYYGDKDEDFATRVSRRFLACGITSCKVYLQLLSDAGAGRLEMDRLVGELTVGETYFFRQREHFELLRHTVLPDLIRRNQASRTLRIWSAGCATGAEPYSISLLLKLDFAAQLSGWDVSILATDINVDFLAQAKGASFAEWALRGVPDDFRNRCFGREGKRWVLRPEFREGVVFEYDNLASDFGDGKYQVFDLILCRNVLIYFSAEQASTVLERFHQSLPEGGWLLVGYAEPGMDWFRAFEIVSTPEATAYRKPPRKLQGRPPWEEQTPGEDVEPSAGADRARAARIPSMPLPQAVTLPTMAPCAEQASRGAASGAAPAGPAPPTVEDVRMLADSGHWDTAIALCERLIETEPLNPATHFLSALIQEHLGAHAVARAAFQHAIYLDRQFALAHYHLGTLLQRDGSPEQARRAFRNALEIVAGASEEEPLPHGDSITAGELRALAALRLEGDLL